MNEKQIKNIIRNSYLKILQREPDIEGLSYYIDLMKKGEINEEKLEHILRNSDEFVGYKQIESSSSKKLENQDRTEIPKIVAMYRIQNEERWIEKSLEAASEVCQEIVILDDCSTDNTLSICKKFPKVVDIYERKKPLPLDEVRDRNKLLKIALKRNPDYVFSIDGDEILAPNSKEILSEELDILYPDSKIFEFQFLYFWDELNKIRYDGLYGKTWQPRLLKIDSDSPKLSIKKSNYSGNLHCGSIPISPKLSEKLIRSNVKIFHYGNFDNNTRQKKFEFYNKHDPNNAEQDGYTHMISEKGRHSGPSGIEFITLPDFMCR